MLATSKELPARAELLRVVTQIRYGMIGISLDRKGNQINEETSPAHCI